MEWASVGNYFKKQGGNAADAVKGDLGIIEKAVIEILDFRERVNSETHKLEPVTLTGKGGATLDQPNGKTATAFADTGMTNDYMGEIANIDNGKNVGSPVNELPGHQEAATLEKVTKKLYTVQFNPTTFQLSANGGGRVRKTDYNTIQDAKSVDGGVSYSRAQTTISLSVSLLFDSVDPQGAFMSDKFNLAPSALVGDVGKLVKYNMGKKDSEGNKTGESQKPTSVQPEVEGLIGALRNRYTRLITFHWGKMSYTGVLRNVAATYTMFDPLGQPVRARVDLSIMCADAEIYPSSLVVWRDRYRTIFSKAKNGKLSNTKWNQYVAPNILNL